MNLCLRTFQRQEAASLREHKKKENKKSKKDQEPWKQNYSEVEVEDIFYTISEYDKLEVKQKRKLAWLRYQRDSGPTTKSYQNISSVSIDKLVAEKVAAALAHVNTSTIGPVETSNRANFSLTRNSIIKFADQSRKRT